MSEPGVPISPPPRAILPPWLRRFARVWGFALFIVFILVVFRKVSLPFVLGALVAYILAPVVTALSTLRVGRGAVPRWTSVLIVYIGLATAIAAFFVAFAPALSGDFARLIRESPRFFAHVKKDLVPKA